MTQHEISYDNRGIYMRIGRNGLRSKKYRPYEDVTIDGVTYELQQLRWGVGIVAKPRA